MIFSSLQFIFRFLPIFLVFYFMTPKKYKNLMLLLGSLFFYGCSDVDVSVFQKGMGLRAVVWEICVQLRFVFLILASMLVNFVLALCIDASREVAYYGGIAAQYAREKRSKAKKCFFFLLALLFDLGVLLFFKYADFFITNYNGLAARFAWAKIELLSLTLPLGISFYTFQIVSYLADVYRGKVKAQHSIVKVGTYLCMFPQLIAGPIVVYPQVAKELDNRRVTFTDIEEGLKIFVLGLGAKVLLADRIGSLWTQIQSVGYVSITTPLAWIGAFAYSFQIYFDFYGYSLMAQGLGRMLGFNLPDNFNMPYLSKSVSEFWRRWHMTLGGWFREYVYIPLGGNRKGAVRTVFNLLVVWLLTGFWHGASWNFVLWGLLIFVLISMEKLFLGKVIDKVPLLGHLYMFFVIPLGWVIFTVEQWEDLKIYLAQLFNFGGGSLFDFVNQKDIVSSVQDYGVLFLLSILFCLPWPRRWYQKHKRNVLVLLFLLAVFWLSVYQLANALNNPFLYFRF